MCIIYMKAIANYFELRKFIVRTQQNETANWLQAQIQQTSLNFFFLCEVTFELSIIIINRKSKK